MRLLFFCWDARVINLVNLAARDLKAAGRIGYAAVVTRETAPIRYAEARGWTSHLDRVIPDTDVVDRERYDFDYRPEVDRLDRLYGRPTLWQYVIQDRFLSRERVGRHHYKYGTPRTPEELLSVVCSSLVNVEKLFDEVQPDLVVFGTHAVPDMLTAMLDMVVHERGGDVVCPSPARLGSRMFFKTTMDDRMERVDREYERLVQTDEVSDEAVEALAAFREGGVRLAHMGRRPESRLKDLANKTRRELSKPLRHLKYRSWRDPKYTPFYQDWYATNRMWRNARWIRSSPLFHEPEPDRPYVLFPMHLEPEQSILVYAPFHTNQFAVIQSVAQAMPADTVLYVKDHTVMLGNRSRSYYEKLARVPNVRLIHPDTPARDVILGSQGVVTISGTAGFEAALHGKPVFTLGRPFYNGAAPMVVHAESERQIAEQNHRFGADYADDRRVGQYVTAVLRHSYDINFGRLVRGLTGDAPADHQDEYQVYLGALTREIGLRERLAETPSA